MNSLGHGAMKMSRTHSRRQSAAKRKEARGGSGRREVEDPEETQVACCRIVSEIDAAVELLLRQVSRRALTCKTKLL